jgi:hypothetical protein
MYNEIANANMMYSEIPNDNRCHDLTNDEMNGNMVTNNDENERKTETQNNVLHNTHVLHNTGAKGHNVPIQVNTTEKDTQTDTAVSESDDKRKVKTAQTDTADSAFDSGNTSNHKGLMTKNDMTNTELINKDKLDKVDPKHNTSFKDTACQTIRHEVKNDKTYRHTSSQVDAYTELEKGVINKPVINKNTRTDSKERQIEQKHENKTINIIKIYNDSIEACSKKKMGTGKILVDTSCQNVKNYQVEILKKDPEINQIVKTNPNINSSDSGCYSDGKNQIENGHKNLTNSRSNKDTSFQTNASLHNGKNGQSDRQTDTSLHNGDNGQSDRQTDRQQNEERPVRQQVYIEDMDDSYYADDESEQEYEIIYGNYSSKDADQTQDPDYLIRSTKDLGILQPIQGKIGRAHV